MKYTFDKKFGKDRLAQQKFLSNYHKWLTDERQKDRESIPDRRVALANSYLVKYICPFCKKKIEVIDIENGVQQKVCKEHGILAVRKKEWRIWRPHK